MKWLSILLIFILILPAVMAGTNKITFVEENEEPLPEVDILCGNKVLDEGENCLNCKMDAVCHIGYECNEKGGCRAKSHFGFIMLIILFMMITIGLTAVTVLAYLERLDLNWRLFANFTVISLLILFVLIIALVNFDSIKLLIYKPSDSHATVVIDEKVMEKLNEYYARSGNEEFVTCLKGLYDEGKYFIHDVTVPTIVESESHMVHYRPCFFWNDLGTLHSHPHGQCRLSKTDVYAFGRSGDIFSGIMCDYNNISIFTRQWLDRSMYYVVKKST